MWPFRKKEQRAAEPHIEVQTSACDEVNQGIGLLQKLLNINEYGAMQQSAFFSAVALISNSVAQMNWELKSYDKEDEPDITFIKNIFENSLLTQFITVKNLIKDTILHGNGFAYIVRDKRGNPISIEYMPFGKVNIKYNDLNRTLFYQIPSISSSLIEPVNVIHLRMITNDGINGISLLEYAKSCIRLNASAEKAATDFFASGMTVNGILSTDTPRLTKDQRESIRSAWNESQLGKGSGLAVLEAGMQYSPISSNSKDAQLVESRLYNVQEVARFFCMSPTLLGDLSKSSFNTLEASQQAFVLHALMPYVIMLEQEINEKILTTQMKKRYYIDICEEDIIKSDKQNQVNYLSTLVDKGIISRNEARLQLGYAPVDGGDELMIAYSDPNQNKITGSNEDKNTEQEQDEQ